GDGYDARLRNGEARGLVRGCVSRAAQHLAAARGVYVENRDAEAHGLAARGGDRVRDVVKLQVEEDARARCDEFADEVGACGCEQLRADLEHASRVAQRFERAPRINRSRNVERDDQLLFRRYALQ